MNDPVPQLARRLTGLAARRPGFAIGLWGEPGVGKTHTALALLRGTPLKSVTVHATQTMAGMLKTIPPLKNPSVWLERSLERLMRGELLEVAPLVQTFAGLLTANAPMVLHVEDLHEALSDRLEFWRQLAHAIPRTRGIGLIMTSRTQPPEGVEATRLGPLSREASDALLEAETGAPLPREALAWVFKHAAGNPLFTLEFFRFLARQGFLWNDGQRWRWRSPERQVMPVTVEAMIERALNDAVRTPTLEAVLEAKTMLGFNANQQLWAEVADLSPEELAASIQALEERGVLASGEFSHPLFKEVLERNLRPERRKTLARRALTALEGNPRMAARFVTAAALEPERALVLLQRAAQAASDAGNPVEAARLQAQAVEYAVGEARAKLALESARVLRTVNFAEAGRLADLAALEPALAEESVALSAELLAVQGRLAEAEERLERLPEAGSHERQAVRRLTMRAMARDFTGTIELWRQPELQESEDPKVLQAVIQALLSLGHIKEARTVFNRAVAQPDLSLADRTALEGFEATLSFHDGEIERAAALWDRRASTMLAGGDLRSAAKALYNQAVALERLGRFRDSVSLYEQSAQRHAELGDVRGFANTRAGAAWVLWHLGEYEDAQTFFLESRDILRHFGPSDYLIECEGCLSLMYLDWSPPLAADLADRHARAALEAARQIGDHHEVVASLYDLVMVRLRQGRATDALALTEEMASIREMHGVSGLAANVSYCRALTLEALGEAEPALSLMREAEAAHQGTEMFKHKIGIEVARMARDLECARDHLEWFKARGVLNGVNILRRYFPELADERPAALPESNPGRLEVLGAMQVRQQDAITPVRGGKRKEFLAMLLEARLAGRQEVSRLDLLDGLYPEAEEAQANASLKDVVHQLRSSLGANAVQTSPNGYALGEVNSDAEDFLRGGDTRLWRGAYLEGLDLGRRGDTAREALYLALRARAEAILETDPSEAARVGRLLCEADPYDLESLRVTLRALREMSNHKSLTRTYTQARERLLEVGETLPERWADFLEAPIGTNA